MTQLITNDKESKEYQLKKLYELSLKSIGEIPQLEELTEEQDKWQRRRMPAPRWQVWDE